jgi:hypothetical protein
MQSFRDTSGQLWDVVVNTNALRRIKSATGLSVATMAADGSLYSALAEDPVLLVDVLCALCKPQMETRKVSEEKFGELLVGDAIDSATTALLEGIIDFFPKARRALLSKALVKIRSLEATAMEMADKALDDPALEKKLKSILSSSATSSAGLPESTPEG